jgi:hypothetical protein
MREAMLSNAEKNSETINKIVSIAFFFIEASTMAACPCGRAAHGVAANRPPLALHRTPASASGGKSLLREFGGALPGAHPETALQGGR